VYFQLVAVFLQRGEVHAFGNDLTSSSNRCTIFRPLALQPLDDLHAGDQTLLAGFEILNIGDLRVELDDLLPEEVVLLDLGVGPTRVDELPTMTRITEANTAAPAATRNSRRRTLRSCSRREVG